MKFNKNLLSFAIILFLLGWADFYLEGHVDELKIISTVSLEYVSGLILLTMNLKC